MGSDQACLDAHFVVKTMQLVVDCIVVDNFVEQVVEQEQKKGEFVEEVVVVVGSVGEVGKGKLVGAIEQVHSPVQPP